jgi:hypothetical protein
VNEVRLILLTASMAAALAGCGASASKKTAPPARGTVAWSQKGFLTHPGNKGTWAMSGAVSDSGTFVSACVRCQSASADLRATYRGARGTLILLAKVRSLHKQTRWTVLSGRRLYDGMHGQGSCTGGLLVNEVSFKDRCTGVLTR